MKRRDFLKILSQSAASVALAPSVAQALCPPQNVSVAGGTPVTLNPPCAPTGPGKIIWNGSFDGGTVRHTDGTAVSVPAGRFRLWHENNSTVGSAFRPRYWGIPSYGRPPKQDGDLADSSYYGDGSLLWLVTSPTRVGTHAARFRVKNSTDPADYDVGPVSTRRRTELWMHSILPASQYGGINYQQTYWFSASYYVPAGFWPAGGSGWGPLIMQVKTASGRDQPTFSLGLSYEDGAYRWGIRNVWHPHSENDPSTPPPWWHDIRYNYKYPAVGSSWASCVADFPLGETSRAALTGLQFDTWTDWVFQVRPDARGAAEGGQGFFKAWKRVGSGAWVPVLHIKPKVTSAGGYTFDHGIWKRSDAGYGPLVGMYLEATQVVGVGERQIIIDNIKVGDGNCVFSQLSPDGSGI